MTVRPLIAALLVLAACSVLRPGSESARVDLNSADARTLATLPGLGPEDAARIVAHRPYATKEDLVRRGVLDQAHYLAIVDRVFLGPPAVPDYLRAVPPVPEVH